MASITGNVSENELNRDKQNQPGQTNVGSTIAPTSSNSSTQNFNQQQQPRQVGSGHFTNIQQYLGANKQAGQQLGQKLEKGIGQQINLGQSTANRQLGEAQQQQQQTQGMYGTGYGQYQSLGGNQQIQGLNATPQQQYKDASGNVIPTSQQQQYTAPTSQQGFAPKGTLANDYTANIGSRQQAATDLASNEEALKQFTGLRTGTTQTEQQSLMQKQNREARDSAEALKAQQMQRMKQLATESGRGGLLSEFVGGKNYGVGQRSLDAAFLQRDPNRAVDTLKQNIGARSGQIQKNLADVGTAETQAGEINKQGQQLSQLLGQQSTQNVQDFTSNLESRIGVMEQQRGQKMDWARKQLEDFKAGKPLNQDFLNLLNVKENTQLFNVPKNLKDVSEFLNTEDMQKKLNIQDVANEKDVAAYKAFAQLAGMSPGEYQIADASKLKDIEQFGAKDARTIQNRAEQARKDFLTNAAKQIISGTTTWVGGQKGKASQNLLDFLTGGSNISKEVSTSGDFSNTAYGNLMRQGGQIGAEIAPYVGSAIGTYFGGPLGGMAGNAVGHLAGGDIIRSGEYLGQAAEQEGGELERGAHIASTATILPYMLLPGDLGIAGRNVNEVLDNFISGVAGFGDTRDSAADFHKDTGYALRRSESYLKNALMQELANSGFYNYMGKEGMQSANPYTIGSWDANTWYDPSQDLAKFGYGSKKLGESGKYDPNRTSVPNIELSPLEQAIPIKPGVSRDEALRQLATTGQLRGEETLENNPTIT